MLQSPLLAPLKEMLLPSPVLPARCVLHSASTRTRAATPACPLSRSRKHIEGQLMGTVCAGRALLLQSSGAWL